MLLPGGKHAARAFLSGDKISPPKTLGRDIAAPQQCNFCME
jgi:hypothetical protein